MPPAYCRSLAATRIKGYSLAARRQSAAIAPDVRGGAALANGYANAS